MNKANNKKYLILLLAAIVMAVTLCFLLYKFLSPNRAIIYTFKDSYEAGTKLSSDMLSSMEVDSNIVIAGKKTDIADFYITSTEIDSIFKDGEYLLNNVGKGKALSYYDLAKTSATSIEKNMKSSSIAVTVDVDNVTGVTSELRIGSHVNVYSNTGDNTELILQNMRVIDVSSNEGIINTVTIECDKQQSLKLIAAKNYGDIHLGLVDAVGYSAIETETRSSED